MLYLIDSNILLHAKMDAMSEHEIASKWLVRTLADPNSTVLVCETTILSFLRISTNSRVFDPPLPAAEAREFITSFIEHERVEVARPLPSHYSEVTSFMEKHNFTGNLTMDAHLAALAMSAGATLVTRDGDFKNIPFLKTINPFHKKARLK